MVYLLIKIINKAEKLPIINKSFLVDIPARVTAPATQIFFKITADSEASLIEKPYIFILPGGPGANHGFYQEYACLSSHGNVVFWDPRGCGLSVQTDPSYYTMDNYIDDVEAIRQQLNLKQIIVLGKSFGAMAAIGFVLRYQSSVSQLILAAGSANFKFLETAKASILTHGAPEQQTVCEKLWTGSFNNNEELDNFFRVMATHYSYRMKIGQTTQSAYVSPYPFSYEWLNRGFSGFLRDFDFENELHLIHCPTLILVGNHDWITNKIHSEKIFAKIPNSQLTIFQKSSHKMKHDVPELYFNAIKGFIDAFYE